MPRTLNLTGFQTGDSLNLSVSQGALTAGPVNVSSWGGPVENGGTITIDVNRTMYQVAPDSVRFTVDLSQATFDVQGPNTGAGEIYDARLHDLIFLWDFDDAATGDWTRPTNVLPEWKNRNVAKGPFVAHMYTSPGTYEPSVWVYEPSSGKLATAQLTVAAGTEIVVADPDTVYGGSGATYADTIVINPTTDGDFSLKPTGAYEMSADLVNISTTNMSAIAAEARPKRFLFKRGTENVLNLSYKAFHEGLYFGDYGDPLEPAPIINIPESTTGGGCLDADGDYSTQGNADPAPDLRVCNLTFKGTLDPTSSYLDAGARVNAGDQPYGIGMSCSRNLDAMLSNCDFDGVLAMFSISPSGPGDIQNLVTHVHIDHVSMTNFGGQYPIFTDHCYNFPSSLAITGCRLAQHPTGIDTGSIDGIGSLGSRAIIRSDFTWLNHMRGCDMYHTDSSQSHAKLIESTASDGAIVNMHSCSTEGGSHAVNISGTLQTGLARSPVSNVILDGLIHVGSHTGTWGWFTYSTGVTIRNCLAIYPAVQRGAGSNNENLSFIQINDFGTIGVDYDATIVGDAPIRIYNNTFVTERTTAQNDGANTTILRTQFTDFTNIVESNNILHKPNYNTPDTTYAPLTDNGTPLWTPRNVGRRSPYDFVLSTTDTVTDDLITPTDAVQSYAPEPTSTALGAAAAVSAGEKIAMQSLFQQYVKTLIANRSIGASEPT